MCGRAGSLSKSSANGVSWSLPTGWRGSLSGKEEAFNCSDECYYRDAVKNAPELAERIGLRLGIVAGKRTKKAAQSEPARYSGPLFDGGDDD